LEPEFVSISPTDVQRGDTDVQMVLTTTCTFFEKDGVDQIYFTPGFQSITVHDIVVEDNTTLSFMIDVAEDASLGTRQMIVEYDEGNSFIVANNVLTVVE
jgi:hypothetical protein